jgi:hypothetical protein
MKRGITSSIHRLGAPGSRGLLSFALLSGAWYFSMLHGVCAVTLEDALRTTLEKNPAIQEAKAGLEQAAGQRLVFRSIVWPQVGLSVPAGVQFGHRAGESGVKGFGVGRGALDQTLFDMKVPPSLRRGDVEVLIAQQQLNVAVVEQLHAARLAFYAAVYNRSLESIRKEQQQRLQDNVTTQRTRYEAGLADKSALTGAIIPATELNTQIEAAHRAYLDAQLQLAQAMAIAPANRSLPEPEGELQFVPMHPDLDFEKAAALERRADVKLARLFVRAANHDERIIAADYYPAVTGGLRGEYVPVTGIHRQGSTSRTQDFIGSEIRERAAYTWRGTEGTLRAGDQRADLPQIRGGHPARAVAHCRMAQCNRGTRRIGFRRFRGCGRERACDPAECGQRPGVPARISSYAKRVFAEQKRLVGCYLSTQCCSRGVGSGHRTLFSVFVRVATFAVG